MDNASIDTWGQLFVKFDDDRFVGFGGDADRSRRKKKKKRKNKTESGRIAKHNAPSYSKPGIISRA